jgi:diguanylate cyclase (GGDEF)-like protein/PAS domain S-box-containing protein
MPDSKPDPSRLAPNNTGDPVSSSAANDILSLRAERNAAVRAAQEAVYNTTRLTRLLTILSEPAPLEILLDRLLATLSELFSADVVVLLDPASTGTFLPLAAYGLPEELIQRPFSDAEDGYVSKTMSTRAPILIAQASTDIKVDPQLRELDVETAVWLPVTGSYAPRGVLILGRCRPAPFAHPDVDLLAAMTYRIGLVLEQVQHGIQIEQIVRTSREIVRHLDESTVCSRATQMFPPVVRADASALFLTGPGSEFVCAPHSNVNPECNNAWGRLAGSLIKNGSFSGGEPYHVPDMQIVDDPSIQVLLTLCPARALLAVPIHIGDQVAGVLFAMRFSIIPFNSDTIQIALLYASQFSAALENSRLYRAVRDELSERNRAEQALRARDERFSAMIRSVTDVIAILNGDGTINYVSPAVESMWGCQVDILIDQNILDRIHPEDSDTMRNLLSAVIAQPDITLTGFMRMRQGMDTWRVFDVILTNLLNEPSVAGIVATYHDITERKIYEQELTRLAFRDVLTGLANRAFFIGKLRHAIDHANKQGQTVALIFFDLDNFKAINDSLGHDKGDEVLQIVADRIRDCLRLEDTAARFGGDEFTILIESVHHLEQVIGIAQRMMSALHEPIRMGQHEFFVSCSMGIAISTAHQDDPEDLLRKADLAMYKAKNSGKGRYALYEAPTS